MSFVSSEQVASLLHKLARGVIEEAEFLSAFKELYKGNKKQLYYKIFEEFSNIQGDTCEDLMRALARLDEILQSEQNAGNVPLHKLFSYLKDKEFILTQGQELKELKSKDENNTAKLSNAVKDIKNAHEKIDKSRTEYVAILGIFAAIIMAFAGGFGLNAKFFETLKSVNFNLYLCAFAAGTFGLFNLITLLLFFCIPPRKHFTIFWLIVNAAIIAFGMYFYLHINAYA